MGVIYLNHEQRVILIESWLVATPEHEHLEFKEAKSTFSRDKIFEYTCAIANEGGGHLILGIADSRPRIVVGTEAYDSIDSLNEIKLGVLQKFGIRIEIHALMLHDQRILDFEIPSRPAGTPLDIDGRFLMRAGESLVPMSVDQMKKILDEGKLPWHEGTALAGLTRDDVANLLDTNKIFELLQLPHPGTLDSICDRLISIKFVKEDGGKLSITNLGAILGAKKLSDFPEDISTRRPRFILYSGISKLETIKEYEFDSGLAVGFEQFIDVVSDASPLNRIIEEVIRRQTKTFPVASLRELIANAFVHQDFTLRGARIMVEMYSDRLEISNPGLPEIKVERFIDDWKSRNEVVADLLRRMGICEEKGSGIDKVVSWAEIMQVPAPEFVLAASRTVSILFAPKKFSEMTRADRVRACYQHCVLKHVMHQSMTNQSLRERFGLDDNQSGVVSDIISAAKQEGLIVQAPGSTSSTRHAKYVPFWAV